MAETESQNVEIIVVRSAEVVVFPEPGQIIPSK